VRRRAAGAACRAGSRTPWSGGVASSEVDQMPNASASRNNKNGASPWRGRPIIMN
jgi:hypothetical protein